MMKKATGEGFPLRQGAGMGLDWFLVAREASGGGTPGLLCSPIVLGYMEIYRRKKYVRGARGDLEGGGRAQGGGRAPLPRGVLISFLTSTPSFLDCVCSKNNYPEGFIPIGLHLIFLFCETLK